MGIIVGVNYVIRELIIYGVEFIKYDTNSEKLKQTTNTIFLAQFFNTGLILLLVNANLTEHSPKFITKFFNGAYYDYYPEWYADVGQKIVQTMMINSMLPYADLCFGIFYPWMY